MATETLMRKGEGSSPYTYSSQPRVVQQDEKYRESDLRPSNIMYDRRIVRGNTYALHSLPASTQPNPLELQKKQESRRRVMARKRVSEHLRIRSPPPIDGRKHVDIQTELYLEEITDRVEEADVCTQTDAFLDRPPTPLFIPAKTGRDAATQIEDGDLFDFDLEVKPILEVLVGKTVEQALIEVMEEEELAALKEQQRIFEENRNAELVETQRLEEQERRNREEKERRMRQQRQAIMKEKETAEKVSARAFAQSYLSDLVPAVFTRLSDGGFFYDPIEREIESMFMPWLMEETERSFNKHVVARQLLDVLIREVVKKKLGIEDPIPEVKPSSQQDDETEPKTEELTSEEPNNENEVSKTEEPTTEEPKNENQKTEEIASEEQKQPKSDEEPNNEQSKTEEPKNEDPATGEEPKPETEEQKLETEEPKPETEESKPETEEPKPETEELKPENEEPKPETEEPKPETEELKPKTEEFKPETEESKPEIEEPPKPETEESKVEEVKTEENEDKQDREEQPNEAELNKENEPPTASTKDT